MITEKTKNLKSLSDVLEHIERDSLYRGYAASFFKNDVVRQQELFSCFVQLLIAVDEAKIVALCEREEFKYYAISMIRNEAINKRSEFNKYNSDSVLEYSPINEPTDEDEVRTHYNQVQTEELLNCIDEYIDSMSKETSAGFYDSQVFKLYYEKYKSFRKFSEASDIPVSALYHSINKTRGKIKKQFTNQYKNICKNGSD